MDKLFFSGSEAEFIALIRSAVREELKSIIGSIGAANANDEPLNIQQASEFLKVPVSTIYNMVSKSEIPYNKPGRRLYFLKVDLIGWVKSGKTKTTAELYQEADGFLTRKK